MVTHFQYAALLLAAAGCGAAEVVSQSTILLDSTTASVSGPASTVKPLTKVSKGAVATTTPSVSATASVTTTASQGSSSAHNIIISSASTASAIPTPSAVQAYGSTSQGGFSLGLEKKVRGTANTNSTTKRGLKSRDDFTASIEGDWLATLDVGTPSQSLELLLDLGSDGFVVESTLIEVDMQTTDYPIYDPNNSTTAQLIDGYSWEDYYGGLTLEGVVYTDVVTMGESSWTNMTMEVVNGEPLGTPVQ